MAVLPPPRTFIFHATYDSTDSLATLSQSIPLNDFIVSIRLKSTNLMAGPLPETDIDRAILAIAVGMMSLVDSEYLFLTVKLNKHTVDIKCGSTHLQMMSCRSWDEARQVLTKLHEQIPSIQFHPDTLVEKLVTYQYELSAITSKSLNDIVQHFRQLPEVTLTEGRRMTYLQYPQTKFALTTKQKVVQTSANTKIAEEMFQRFILDLSKI